MTQRRSLRAAVLDRAWGYALFTKVLRANRARDVLVRDHIRPPKGGRVLDLGCGDGELADHLGEVEYVGIDSNVDYIDSARRGTGTATSKLFLEADLADLDSLEVGTFDVILAMGVLHHLPSRLAVSVLAGAAARLRPEGRLVTLDPVFHPDQRAIARVLMALDRGLYVRHPEDYDALVATSFSARTTVIRTDLTPFPYTHCIIEAQLHSAGEQTQGQLSARA